MVKIDKKIRISVYVRSSEISPSGYYRIVQYINSEDFGETKVRSLLTEWQFRVYFQLKQKHLFVRWLLYGLTYWVILVRITYFLICDFLKKPDYLVLSRVFIPRLMPYYIRVLVASICKKTVFLWDFDDDILESKQISKSSFSFLSSKSYRIIVIHEYLRSLIEEKYWNKVVCLPTVDGDMRQYDIRNLASIRRKMFDEEIHLVWVGTSGNLEHLDTIIKVLDNTAIELENLFNKRLILKVVCNSPYITKTQNLIIENIKWTRLVAIESMKHSHIGIMPLRNTVFAKGKGGFKLVQYMSIGLPVIGSNVGFNRKIVDTTCGYLVDDSKNIQMWKNHILDVADSWSNWNQLSIGAKQKWDKDFSFSKNYNTWLNLLNIHNEVV